MAVQCGQSRQKAPLIGQASQIEYQSSILDPPDYGPFQAAKSGRKPVQRATTSQWPNDEARTGDSIERQRAGSDLALTLAHRHGKGRAHRRRHSWQQAVRLSLDLRLGSGKKPQCWQTLGEAIGVEVEFQGGLDSRQPDLVHTQRAFHWVAVDCCDQRALADNEARLRSPEQLIA